MKCLECNHELGDDGVCLNCKKVKKLVEADLARRRAPATRDSQPLNQQPQASTSAKKPIIQPIGKVQIVFGIIGLAMLCGVCFKGPRERIPGEVCVVKRTSDDFKTFAFSSEAEYLKMLGSLRIKDGEGIVMQGVYGGMIGLEPKTQARILAYHPRTETYEVRVLEGDYYSQVVWLPSNSLE